MAAPRRPTIFVFLTVVTVILGLISAVLYGTVALILGITAPIQLVVLGVCLGLFSGSFIVATLIGTRFHNWFTRVYYTVSAVWIGSIFYLFAASAVYIFLVAITGQSLTMIGAVLLGAAIILNVYAVIHARKISIVHISVSLSHLPDSWKGRKALWMSDLHLGQLHGPVFAGRVARVANALKPDIMFIGGDLYDGTAAPDLDELILPLKQLSAPHGVYFITGNHEEYGNIGKFIGAVKAIGIRVIQDEILNLDSLQLIGVDYRHASDAGRFKEILSSLRIDKTKASILLKHEPNNLDIAQAAGISLQISGHTHRAQLWPFEYLAQSMYKGFAYGLKDFKSMRVYTSSGVGTWGPPMRLGTNGELVLFTFSK